MREIARFCQTCGAAIETDGAVNQAAQGPDEAIVVVATERAPVEYDFPFPPHPITGSKTTLEISRDQADAARAEAARLGWTVTGSASNGDGKVTLTLVFGYVDPKPRRQWFAPRASNGPTVKVINVMAGPGESRILSKHVANGWRVVSSTSPRRGITSYTLAKD